MKSRGRTGSSEYRLFSLSYAWYALLLLTFLNLFNYADRNIVVVLLEPLKREFSLTDQEAGLLNLVFMVVFSLAAYPLARRADRGIRKNIVALGGILWSLATFLTAFCAHYWQMLMARAVVGIGEAAYACAIAPLIADYFPLRLRATTVSIANSAIGLGTVMGFLLGGFVYQHAGWRGSFLILGLPGLVVACLVAFLKEPVRGLAEKSELSALGEEKAGELAQGGAEEEEREGEEKREESLLEKRKSKEPMAGEERLAGKVTAAQPGEKSLRSLLAPVREILSIPTIRFLYLAGVLLSFGIGGILFWLPSFLQRYHGFSLTEAATKGAVVAGIGLISGMLLGGVVADALQKRWKNGPLFVLLFCLLMSPAPFLTLLLGMETSAIYVGIFFLVFFLMASIGPSSAAQLNVLPPALRSTASAVYLFLIHLLGDGISPLLTGALSDALGGLRNALLFLPVFLLAAGVMAAFALKSYSRDVEAVRLLMRKELESAGSSSGLRPP